MMGRKLTSDEMIDMGIANQVFPDATFRQDVSSYLNTQLEVNDHKSMLGTSLAKSPWFRGFSYGNFNHGL